MKEDTQNYQRRFIKLFRKWWLIIFFTRAILVSVTMFDGTWLFLSLLGPFGILLTVLTPEVDIAVKLFGGMAFAYWQVVTFSLFLIALTSSVLAALIASLAALGSRK